MCFADNVISTGKGKCERCGDCTAAQNTNSYLLTCVSVSLVFLCLFNFLLVSERRRDKELAESTRRESAEQGQMCSVNLAGFFLKSLMLLQGRGQNPGWELKFCFPQVCWVTPGE